MPSKRKPAATMTITDLVAALANAKATELLATEERIRLEGIIADELGGPKDGAKTHTMKDGTKVTVKRGFIFAANIAAIRKMYRVHELDSSPPIKTTITDKLDEAAYKAIAKERPVVYRRLSEHVSIKPRKTSVTIKHPDA